MSERALFDDLADLTDHEIEALIGSKRPPKLPPRYDHPVSRQFPSLSAEAFSKLVDDIRVNGQKKAIAMYEGYIWDGRARYEACVSLGLVPKVFVLRREPIVYLIHRHDRYGRPSSPERHEALDKLHRIRDRSWLVEQKKHREDWVGYARHEFKEAQRYRYPEKCAVCGLPGEYSHAHHSLPLSLQYALGVDDALHEIDWLCPVHHKELHRMIASMLTGATRRHDHFPSPDATWLPAKDKKLAAARFAVFERARKLFAEIGGTSPAGNWRMFTP